MVVGISLLSLREGGFIMSCKKNLRYLISALFLTIVVMITAACSQKEIMEDAAGIETPPAQAESAPSPEPADAEVSPAPAPLPAPEPPPVVIAQQTPAVKPAAPAGGQIPAQYKNIYPSLLIYLSSRGVLSRASDPS